MSRLSPDARKLFEGAQSSFSPDETRLAKVAAALTAQVGGGVAGFAGAELLAKKGALAYGVGGASAAKIAGLGLLIAALGGGALAVRALVSEPSPGPSAPSVSGAAGHSLRALTVGSAAVTPRTESRDRTNHADRGSNRPPELELDERAAVTEAPVEHALAAPNDTPARSAVPSLAPAPRASGVTKVFLDERAEPQSRPPPSSAAAVAGKERPRVAPAEPVVSSPPPAQNPASDSLTEEIGLLRGARGALASGNAARALALLDEHARDYPRGSLQEERLATRALALCALGRVAEARAVAASLERAAPRSPHLERVRASCAR